MTTPRKRGAQPLNTSSSELVPPTPESNSPRTRGAQIGNTNALKHGFYPRQFQQLELSRCLQQTYENPTLLNLLDCIDVIRAYRRALLN